MPRPFRFGVVTTGSDDGAAWRQKARRAELLGYSSLLLPDHFQVQWGPLVAAAIAAEATERLKVGTLVLCNDYRHPVVLAKEIATLDLASGGRVEIGLGAGWKRADYDQAGLPFDPPPARIARMAEALQVMKALWGSGEPVELRGRFYAISGAVGTPRPVSRPHPPICIGGGGRRVLSLAAREAQIVSLNATLRGGAIGPGTLAGASPASFDEKLAWVREAAGARFGEIELQCHCPFVTVGPGGRAAAEALARQLDLSVEHAPWFPLALCGSEDELCDALERRRERWGFSYTIVPSDRMEAFAPIVARLAGR
jgi:probable F420-dependent oxidoreductase